MINKSTQLATFGAGCFWGIQSAFDELKGVTQTYVGYAGGTTENPTYEEVCSQKTGHAEVVEVTYDPSIITYLELLKAFWKMHNPTQVDRQGPDVGKQYRSVIFFHDDKQREQAEQSKTELENSGSLAAPIATAIEPAPTFYKAEEYHQKYFEKTGRKVCH